ncbi:STY0301 family protein [Burkholderia sp. IMCC1007]|uniref:STY0301 family protein n=1 Tax=Burkholderia sp. IMCC1007 TaxID=3004104 RepID=UPI0022B50668|nr:STY0301 family protein [Burkholderia sp. IMCC1007]
MMPRIRQTPSRLLALAALAYSLLAALPASAAPADCPARVAVTQQIDGQPPDGWKTFNTQSTYPLASVTFWSGPPDRMTSLVPNRSRAESKSDIYIWSLAESREDYWISCDYGNTSVVIARPLGKHAQTCVARYRRGHAIVQSWECTPRK